MIGVKEKNFFKFLLTEYSAQSFLLMGVAICFYPRDTLSIVGAFVLLKSAFDLASWIRKMFFRKAMKDMPKRYGKWAVVTGASEGIGAAIAVELARRGFSIVLIARTESKMKGVAEQIKQTNSAAETRIIVADFSLHERSCYPLIASQIKDLDVGVLVNNVGVANDIPERLLDQDPEFVRRMIEINTVAAPTMCAMVLPKMVENRRGLIMNIGSASASHPTPLLAIYSATKAYLRQFSESLSYEYRPQGIDVICLAPYYVTSALSGIDRPSLLVCSAERFAQDCMKHVDDGSYSNPYWFHALFEYLAKIYPRTPQRLVIMMEKSRARNLARRAKATSGEPEKASH
eukprot:TRINITY_DN11937_c0_g1_i2.p1 TRINITY_DN11937_c0_g1~~TRINITY_DN11937_c0_g1_i2.p1  ORF type:complete len:345 (-),score=82.18 TRINITY_DN11937_c0_g1_i2:37-1071(-)